MDEFRISSLRSVRVRGFVCEDLAFDVSVLYYGVYDMSACTLKATAVAKTEFCLAHF